MAREFRKKFIRKIAAFAKDFHPPVPLQRSAWKRRPPGSLRARRSPRTTPMEETMNFHRFVRYAAALVLAMVGIFCLATARQSAAEEMKHDSTANSAKYLFICAGDQARTVPDFLAVVNFDERSPQYGKVIAKAPLPEPGATGNEFHHIGLSADSKVAACGGLLSVLKGQKEIFFFDVSEPAAPKFISSADPPLSAITDEFHALPEGGFLVTMMGGAQGHAPGRVAEFDKNLNLMQEHPANPPEEGL